MRAFGYGAWVVFEGKTYSRLSDTAEHSFFRLLAPRTKPVRPCVFYRRDSLGNRCGNAVCRSYGILTAIYLSEYAPKWLRESSKPVVDLLAGISPVIYGVWGVIAVVPIVRDYIMPFFSERFSFFPFASDNYTGFSALSAGIVLAVMVVPLIISVVQEVLRTVPNSVREASLALGATQWQTIKLTVLKRARPGLSRRSF